MYPQPVYEDVYVKGRNNHGQLTRSLNLDKTFASVPDARYWRDRYWRDRAAALAGEIVDRIGGDAYDELVAPLPQPATWREWFDTVKLLHQRVFCDHIGTGRFTDGSGQHDDVEIHAYCAFCGTELAPEPVAIDDNAVVEF